MWIVAEIRCQILTGLKATRNLTAVWTVAVALTDSQYASSIHVTWYVLKSRREGRINAIKLLSIDRSHDRQLW